MVFLCHSHRYAWKSHTDRIPSNSQNVSSYVVAIFVSVITFSSLAQNKDCRIFAIGKSKVAPWNGSLWLTKSQNDYAVVIGTDPQGKAHLMRWDFATNKLTKLAKWDNDPDSDDEGDHVAFYHDDDNPRNWVELWNTKTLKRKRFEFPFKVEEMSLFPKHRTMLIETPEKSARLVSMETGKILRHFSKQESHDFTEMGDHAYIIDPSHTIGRIHLGTAKETRYKTDIPNSDTHGQWFGSSTFRTTGVVLYYSNPSKDFVYLDPQSGKTKYIPLGTSALASFWKGKKVPPDSKTVGLGKAFVSDDGTKLLRELYLSTKTSHHTELWLTNLKTGESKLVTKDNYHSMAKVPGKNQVVLAGDTNHTFSFENEKLTEGPKSWEQVYPSNDGQNILIKHKDGSLEYRNASHRFNIPGQYKDSYFATHEKFTTTNAEGGKVRVRMSDGDVFLSPFRDDSTYYDSYTPSGALVRTLNGSLLYFEETKICVPLNNTIDPKQQTLCLEQSAPSQDEIKNLDNLTETFQQLMCQQPFASQEKLWERLTPKLQGKRISPQQAVFFLKRFQKPGGFDPKKHIAILHAILEYFFHTDGEKRDKYISLPLIQAAMGGVLHSSDLLYLQLLRRFPQLKKDSPVLEQKQWCLTTNERAQMQKLVLAYLDEELKVGPDQKGMSQLRQLSPLSPHLKQLPEKKRSELLSKMSAAVRDGIGMNHHEYKDIFPSKIYYFARENIKPMLGIAKRPFTDLTLVRRPVFEHRGEAENFRAIQKQSIAPYVLGTEPFNLGELASHFEPKLGFHIYRMKSHNLESRDPEGKLVFSANPSWQHNGAHYRSSVSVRMAKKRELVPKQESLRYHELWKDNTMAGMVVMGSKLSGEYPTMMSRYEDYYKERGYTFSKSYVHVSDMPELLEATIAGTPLKGYPKGFFPGVLDYFIKEAHSGGDEKNLFQMDKQAKIKKGVRIRKDGRKETVYLVFPSREKNFKTKYLSNADFGSSLRAREKNGFGQFVYLNTSCNSCSKARDEISAANTPVLMEIPSITSVNVFRNSKQHVQAILMDAMFAGKNFREMEDLMKNDPNYCRSPSDKANKRCNVMILPGSQEYYESVTNQLKIPINLQLEVEQRKPGEAWKPYLMQPK